MFIVVFYELLFLSKDLERFEMNGRLNCKLQTLSCLPSDVAVYFGFMQMPELKNILIHRSLVKPERFDLYTYKPATQYKLVTYCCTHRYPEKQVLSYSVACHPGEL